MTERASSRPGVEDSEWRSLLEGTLLAVLEGADEGMLVFDRGGKCRMIGRRTGDLFGLDPKAYVGKLRDEVLGAMSRSCEEPHAFLEVTSGDAILDPPLIVSEIDLVQPMPRKVEWRSFPIVRQGAALGRLVLVRDVTRERAGERAQKQLQTKLDSLVPVDALTGLPNARRFREELEREHGRSTRAWDSYGVLRVDVDGMRALNDEFGTTVGDDVIERVGECLNRCRREYDTVARLDGDEFVVLLPGADLVAARAVADRMSRAVGSRDFELAEERRVTVSIGGCVWVPPSGETGEDILRRASDALERAREVARGQVVVDATQS